MFFFFHFFFGLRTSKSLIRPKSFGISLTLSIHVQLYVRIYLVFFFFFFILEHYSVLYRSKIAFFPLHTGNYSGIVISNDFKVPEHYGGSMHACRCAGMKIARNVVPRPWYICILYSCELVRTKSDGATKQ